MWTSSDFLQDYLDKNRNQAVLGGSGFEFFNPDANTHFLAMFHPGDLIAQEFDVAPFNTSVDWFYAIPFNAGLTARSIPNVVTFVGNGTGVVSRTEGGIPNASGSGLLVICTKSHSSGDYWLNLRRLFLREQSFFGPIPNFVLKYTEWFDISNNGFTGNATGWGVLGGVLDLRAARVIDFSFNEFTKFIGDGGFRADSVEILQVIHNNIDEVQTPFATGEGSEEEIVTTTTDVVVVTDRTLVSIVGAAGGVVTDTGFHVLTEEGNLWGWGSQGQNSSGMIGDDSTTSRRTPVKVCGGHTFISVTRGLEHTVAIDNLGQAWSWGGNIFGELGDGTSTSRRTPVLVCGGHTWTQVGSFNIGHTVGLTTSGTAYAWGWNGNGWLGDNTTTNRNTPTLVCGGHTFIYVSGASAGIDESNNLWRWGGIRVGDNTTTQRNTPTLVCGGHSWTSFADVPNRGLAGAVRGWGLNEYGEVGDNTTTQRLTPVQVCGGGTAFIQQKVVGGINSFTLSRGTDGFVRSWGRNNGGAATWGQLGRNTNANTSSLTPVFVCGLSSIIDIAATGGSGAGITSLDAFAWGWGGEGQLGRNSTTNNCSPTAVCKCWVQTQTTTQTTTQTQTITISANNWDPIADYPCTPEGWVQPTIRLDYNNLNKAAIEDVLSELEESGPLSTAWAASFVGNPYEEVPEQAVADVLTVYPGAKINFGEPALCADPVVAEPVIGSSTYQGFYVSPDGDAYAWGLNSIGDHNFALNDGTNVDKCLPSKMLISVGEGSADIHLPPKLYPKFIGAFYYKDDGGDNKSLAGWSPWYNYTSTVSPTQFFSQSFKMISPQDSGHSLFIDENDITWAWALYGQNSRGELGDGTTAGKNTPVQVCGGHTFVHVYAGLECSFAIDINGDGWSWGRDAFGVLGLGTQDVARNTPTLICGGHKWKWIHTNYIADFGRAFAHGITTDGDAYGWGLGWFGQIGDGATVERLTPTLVCGGIKFKMIRGGYHGVWAIDENNDGWTWGTGPDFDGRLGDGTTAGRITPVRICGGQKWKDIRPMRDGAIGIDENNVVWSWGRNDFGNLGDGTGTARLEPVLVCIP